ncbi:TonB family protein [Mesorhizobium sp. KR1-2]|uniref:cell envelope integrity protein TolA n=1 Tax=Mesorhizobium sp. KR1-2 TaxID=3156609 RepID=UPI0032B614FD
MALASAFARDTAAWPPPGFQALRRRLGEPSLILPLGPLWPCSCENPEPQYELTADPALDYRPAEPLDIAPTMPKAQRSRWSGATIVASIAFHAAASLCFMAIKDDGVLIAGADNAGIAMFGNAAENLRAAGDSADDGTPVTNVTLVTMPDPTQVQNVEAQTAAEAPSIRPVDAPAVETAVNEMPAPTEQATERPKPPAAEPYRSEAAAEEVLPAEPAAPILAAEAAEPVEEAAVKQPSAVAPRHEPAEKPEEVPPLQQPRPEPLARPSQAEKTEPRKVTAAGSQKRAEKPAERPALARSERSSGSRGNAALDARRGKADGQKNGSDGIASNGGTTGVGNAAVSNYSGKIVAKLRQALRYPAQARRQGVHGETLVSFVVAADGRVSSIRMVGSSGSTVLDKAALDAVRRAAPFPPIPEAAGRSSWNFTVPLAFNRTR